VKRALAAVAVIALAGCGGDEGGRGTLVWQGKPTLVRATTRPADRVLIGTVRNDSLRPVSLTARKLRVRDARGRPVPAFAEFAAAYAHSLYGAYQRPDPLPEDELVRLGLLVRIDPGKTAPLVVSYRLHRRLKLPLAVDYGQGFLPIPARSVAPARPS
jgi:hypothetical protein